MAQHEIKEQHSTIISLKQPGDTFKGWITSSHVGKFGTLFDGFNDKGEPVSIQPNQDLKSRLQWYQFGCWISIELISREKQASGNEYKKHKVIWDDDQMYAWSNAMKSFLRIKPEQQDLPIAEGTAEQSTEDTPF